MTTAVGTLIPSCQRPIPLMGRGDLRIERIEYGGTPSFVIKDPIALKYSRLEAEQYAVLKLLDGERSLEEIRDELQREFPTVAFRLIDVQRLVTQLHKTGLLLGDRVGQGIELVNKARANRRKKFLSAFKNILYLRLPGWDPQKFLDWLNPRLSWMFHPVAVACGVALILASWVLLAVQFEEFRTKLPEFHQFFSGRNLVLLWATLGISKIIHEFGHGLSCRHFGGECHSMGIMLLIFSPCLYCDVSDSWMMRNKWHRIIIGGAGMAIEMVLSAIALFAWWNTQPGLLNHLCLNLFSVTAVTTVMFNANPLMRLDGYFMLSDFLEIPNLRQKADRMLQETFAWCCFGIEFGAENKKPEHNRAFFIVYAILAWLYRWVVFFGITMFLYSVLKPYKLQSIGVTLAFISVAGMVSSMLMQLYRILAAPRSQPMDYRKVTLTAFAVCLLATAALALPLPLHVETPFLIEPENVAHVFTTTPGRLISLETKPGDQVSAGQVLAVLTNDEKEDRFRQLKVRREMQNVEVAMFRALDNAGQEQIAVERVASLEEQLKDFEQQISELTLRAPVAGVVVAPQPVQEPSADPSDKRLRKWFGTPLDPKNSGCYLDTRTHLASIAPTPLMNAVLLIDQADRNDMQLGQKVELRFENIPDRTYSGSIEQISERHVEFAPPALSNKQGGRIPTVTDAQGRERLVSIAYEATVKLDSDTQLIKPGMRGRARFVVDRRSTAGWLWRYFRQTFHFRV